MRFRDRRWLLIFVWPSVRMGHGLLLGQERHPDAPFRRDIVGIMGLGAVSIPAGGGPMESLQTDGSHRPTRCHCCGCDKPLDLSISDAFHRIALDILNGLVVTRHHGVVRTGTIMNAAPQNMRPAWAFSPPSGGGV